MSLLKGILNQCKRPSGRLGRFLAAGMNYGHSSISKWGLGFIKITSDTDVLDIGCGGGKTVKRLAEFITDGKVVGIDYSPDAVVVARKKNRALINEGRVEIFQEAVSSMRFSNGAFGLITAFETHCFWPDFRNDFKEVHRMSAKDTKHGRIMHFQRRRIQRHGTSVPTSSRIRPLFQRAFPLVGSLRR